MWGDFELHKCPRRDTQLGMQRIRKGIFQGQHERCTVKPESINSGVNGPPVM